MSEFIKKAEAARRLGIQRQTLNDHLKSGKVKGVREDGLVDYSVVRATYSQYVNQYKTGGKTKAGDGGESLEESIKRKAAADATIAELKAKKDEGLLVDVEVVRREVMTVAREARDALLSIPDRIATQLVSVEDVNMIHRTIHNEIFVALSRITAETTTEEK